MKNTLRIMAFSAILLFGMGADAGASSPEDAVGILREFGFPIFVSLWFMWRVEKRMDGFTAAIQNLLTAVTIMAKTVDGWTPAHGIKRTHPAPQPHTLVEVEE